MYTNSHTVITAIAFGSNCARIATWLWWTWRGLYSNIWNWLANDYSIMSSEDVIHLFFLSSFYKRRNGLKKEDWSIKWRSTNSVVIELAKDLSLLKKKQSLYVLNCVIFFLLLSWRNVAAVAHYLEAMFVVQSLSDPLRGRTCVGN